MRRKQNRSDDAKERRRTRIREQRAEARAELLGKISELIAHGYYATEIADKLGIKPHAVPALVRHWNLKPIANSKRAREAKRRALKVKTRSALKREHARYRKVDRLREMIDAGQYLDECAVALGVRDYVIKAMVSRYQLPQPLERTAPVAPDTEDRWAVCLAGQRYEDAWVPVLAPRRLRMPMPSLSANSSAAWAV